MIRYLQVRKPRRFSRFVEGDRPQPEWSRLRLSFFVIREGARLVEDFANAFPLKTPLTHRRSPGAAVWMRFGRRTTPENAKNNVALPRPHADPDYNGSTGN